MGRVMEDGKVRRVEGQPRAYLSPHPPGVTLPPHRDRIGSDLPLRGPCHPRFLGNWMAQMRRRRRGCLGLSCSPPAGRLTCRHWPSCFRSSWKPSTRRSSEHCPACARPTAPLAVESNVKARAHILSHHPQGIFPAQYSLQYPGIPQDTPRSLLYDFPIQQRLYLQIPNFSTQYINIPPVHHRFHDFTQPVPRDSGYPKIHNTSTPFQNIKDLTLTHEELQLSIPRIST